MPFFVGPMLTTFELTCVSFGQSTSRHYLDMRSLMADADYTPLLRAKASSSHTALRSMIDDFASYRRNAVE